MTTPTKYIILLLTVFFFSCNEEPAESKTETVDNEPTNREMLIGGLTENLVVIQGDWQNQKDESETISVEKNKFLWKKSSEEEVENWIEAYSNCPNFCSTKNSNVSQYPCFILKNGNSAECYAILKLDKDELVFTAIAGKPNVLTFQKVKD